MSASRINRRRAAHKSTGGMLHSIPAPVDPVGSAPQPLTSNTVALPSYGRGAVRVLQEKIKILCCLRSSYRVDAARAR